MQFLVCQEHIGLGTGQVGSSLVLGTQENLCIPLVLLVLKIIFRIKEALQSANDVQKTIPPLQLVQKVYKIAKVKAIGKNRIESIIFLFLFFVIEICEPGTYSSNGLAPCDQCPKGYYQLRSGQQLCVPCSNATINPQCYSGMLR